MKNNIIIILIFTCLIICLYHYFSNTKLKTNLNKNNQELVKLKKNIKAKEDSILTYINENGELCAEISSLQLTVDEYKSINKVKKDEKPIAKIDTKFEINDTIKEFEITKKDQDFLFARRDTFGHSNERLITGHIFYYGDSISLSSIHLKQVMGFTSELYVDEKTDMPKIRIKTDYPGVEIKHLNSELIISNDIKKNLTKKWGLGIQLGYGLYLNETVSKGMYIGVGIQRNLIRF